jgi:hypothetical protein
VLYQSTSTEFNPHTMAKYIAFVSTGVEMWYEYTSQWRSAVYYVHEDRMYELFDKEDYEFWCQYGFNRVGSTDEERENTDEKIEKAKEMFQKTDWVIKDTFTRERAVILTPPNDGVLVKVFINTTEGVDDCSNGGLCDEIRNIRIGQKGL